MFNTRPKDCNKCGGKNTVKFGLMEDFGIKPYGSGYCYICTECGAYIGTHKGRHEDAMGELGTKTTRNLRQQCHEEFEKHYLTRSSKSAVYYRLSQEMDIPYEECHFGMMDDENLERALKIMKRWGDSYFVR